MSHWSVTLNQGGILKTKELADRLGIAPVTVRLWTKEYGEFLEPSARGGGKNRTFSDLDARVMAHIVHLKANGQGRDDITATLKTLQAIDWQGLPDMPPAPPGIEPISVIPREAAEARIDAQRAALMREIATLQDTVERLEGELDIERQDNRRLNDELANTREKLGNALGKLAIIEQERQPAAYWIRVLLIALIGVLIIGGLAVAFLATRPIG